MCRQTLLIVFRAFSPQRLTRLFPLLLSLVVTALFFFPTLYVGLSGDDVYRSSISVIPVADHLPSSEVLRWVMRCNDSPSTGYHPLFAGVFRFWQTGPSDSFARIVQLLLVLADVALFHTLVKRLLRDDAFACFSVAIVCATSTFSASGNDPILSNIVGWPILILLLLAAVSFWLQALEHSGRLPLALAASLASYALALLWDSAALFAVIVFIVTTATSDRPTKTKQVGLCGFLALAGLELFLSGGEPFVHLVWSLHDLLQRVAVQFIAALPLVDHAYHAIGRDAVVGFDRDYRLTYVRQLRIEGWCTIILIGAITYVAVRRRTRRATPHVSRALVVGGALWIAGTLAAATLPATMGVSIGEPYPSVYLERFGVALVMVGILAEVRRRETSSTFVLAPISALLVAVFSFGTLRIDGAIFDRLQTPVSTAHLFSDAARAGLLARVPSEATIHLANDLPFRFEPTYRSARYTLFRLTGRPYKVADARSRSRCGTAQRCDPRDREWILHGSLLPSPFVQVGRLANDDAEKPRVDKGSRYERFATEQVRSTHIAALREFARGVTRRLELFSSTDLVQEIDRRCGAVPFQALNGPDLPTVAWGDGFLRIPTYALNLPRTLIAIRGLYYRDDADPSYRIGGRSVTLVLRRDRCLPRTPYALSVEVATPIPAIVTATMPDGSTTSISTNQQPHELSFRVGTRVPSPVTIRITTTSSAAAEDRFISRYTTTRPFDVHMVLLGPSAIPVEK
jgi:hypothetical protein